MWPPHAPLLSVGKVLPAFFHPVDRRKRQSSLWEGPFHLSTERAVFSPGDMDGFVHSQRSQAGFSPHPPLFHPELGTA